MEFPGIMLVDSVLSVSVHRHALASTSSTAMTARSFLKPVLAFRANASFAPRPPAPLFASSTEVLTHILVNLLADPPAIF
jgi:hypothetical protein